MKLYLDTTNNLKTIIKLDSQEYVREYQSPHQQDIIGAINEALKEQNMAWSDISEIEVNPGPGSFTGIRVGIAVANALAFANRILVNGQKPPLTAQYGSEPHITVSKKSPEVSRG